MSGHIFHDLNFYQWIGWWIQSVLGCCEGKNSEEDTHSGIWGWNVCLREREQDVVVLIPGWSRADELRLKRVLPEGSASLFDDLSKPSLYCPTHREPRTNEKPDRSPQHMGMRGR